MLSRSEQLKKNARNSSYKFKNKNKGKKRKHHKPKKGKSKDEMDKFIAKINTFKNLDEFTVEKITKKEGTADRIAEYFTNRKNNQLLNTNQLRDIHNSIKKIYLLNKNWDQIKLYYNLFVLDIQLKHEKNVIPYKFYELIHALTDIIDKLNDENQKVQNLDKIYLLINSVVGYHKYYDADLKYDKSFNEKILKIDNEYLLNLLNNNEHVRDAEDIVNNLNNKNSVTIYQMRKIFNEFKYMEHKLGDWTIIENRYYEFYPKLAYITGRKLIPVSYYKLLIQCMNVINQGESSEKIKKFKNFIKYLEAIISFATYENKKYSLVR